MDKMFGVMIDCSRNAVMTVDAVKRFASLISKMGYNTLMLYTEDTYEVEGQPFFGYRRGRYSIEELKEIDAFCRGLGIELVPCIQTLAHLNCMFRWDGEYSDINDCDDILLVGEPRTYELIEDMFKSISKAFSSRKIHIGMDEAYRVGTGKYKNKHGARDRFDVINEHLHAVCDIAEKYGFEPMIWSDMFCKLAMNTENQYAVADLSKITEKAALPDNISLVYWDYYSDDPERYERLIKTNKLFGRKVYFAGGAWTWNGFAPTNAMSIKNTRAAFSACDKCGVDGVFLTIWGDDGGECSPFAVLPTLCAAAEMAKGNDDEEDVKKRFRELTGCDFDGFMLFDKLDYPGGKHMRNPSKYVFYNDVLSGVYDVFCSSEDRTFYGALAQSIENQKERGDFGYLYDVYAKLARVLELKSDIGLRLREAYKNKDKEALKGFLSELMELSLRINVFYSAHKKRWFTDDNPFGFDVQDIRIGGLLRRVESCRERIEDYLTGAVTEIPELEEELLPFKTGNNKGFWGRSATSNAIGFMLK